jgi:hypothetical protein
MGRWLKDADVDNSSFVCILNADAAEKLIGYTDCVGQTLILNGAEFSVVGVLEKDDSSLMSMLTGGSMSAYIPYSTLIRLTDTVGHDVTSFYASAPIGGVLCYCAIAAMNLIAIRKLVPQKPALLKNLLRSGLPALIMGVVVFACSWAMENLLHITSRVLLCGLPIAVGAVVFFVTVVLCKAITREDCQLLPKGDKIAKLLRL